MGKIAVIFGTRPEIIKLSPVIRRLRESRKHTVLIHTGQHYAYEMDRLFFEELGLPTPHYRLTHPGGSVAGHGTQTARMLKDLDRILSVERPQHVLVQGDTNSVLAGALAASKIPGVKLGHVEAGLRSYDRTMPEEINRMIADRLSDFLFAPTPLAKKILLNEGAAPRSVYVTGNTIVDAVFQNLAIALRKFSKRTGVYPSRGFFLMTLHRPENVDNKKRFTGVLQGARLVNKRFKLPVLFPIHPRTERRLQEFGLSLPDGVHTMRPTGFLEFLMLESRARMILSDSGGVQEEACILKTPCVTLRDSTERPETLEVGSNKLAGFLPKNILRCAEQMINKKPLWRNPFGDGRAAERIVRVL